MTGMAGQIIFCHYGDTPYLRYTLAAAVATNPERTMVLLGDHANAHLANVLPIRHIPFSSLEYGDELAEFDRVYRPVQGKLHIPIKGGRDWLNFVFRRWFYVLNHLRSSNAAAFWHFDSDTMLLYPLPADKRFDGLVCTEQCEGTCLNGWISGPDLVARYCRAICEIFTRREYLGAQQREFDTSHPNWAFTEMRAWALYRTENRLPTRRLSEVDDNTTFDDCWCHDHSYVMDRLRHRQPVKKVCLGPGGSFWLHRARDNKAIRLNSLNLSWVPNYTFAQVANHLRTRGTGPVPQANEATEALNLWPTLASRPIPWFGWGEHLSAMTRVTVKRLLGKRVRWP